MSSTNENRVSSTTLFVLAAIAFGLGLYLYAGGARCDGEPLGPGDSCYVYGRGSTSYEDTVATNRAAPLWGSLIGLVLLGFGLVARRGDRRDQPGPEPTRPPLARTPAEGHLAMALSPCPCGSAESPDQSALYEVDGGFIRRYSGACRSCGRPREFTFRLPETPLVTGPDEFRFGDGSPSQLIDPGGWLALADHYARLAPADASGLDTAGRRTARQNLARAAAAMDEVIAFLPRGGTVVPASAFFSPSAARSGNGNPAVSVGPGSRPSATRTERSSPRWRTAEVCVGPLELAADPGPGLPGCTAGRGETS